MRGRAEELAGRCLLEASAGGGTRVRALLPLETDPLLAQLLQGASSTTERDDVCLVAAKLVRLSEIESCPVL